MLFEQRCGICDSSAERLCRQCRYSLTLARVDPGLVNERAAELGLDSLAAVFDYDEVVAKAILAAKNGGRRDLLRVMAHWLSIAIETSTETVAFNADTESNANTVTWVPASRPNKRRRGYDQGAILARSLAAELGVRAAPLLKRQGSAGQKGASREQRLLGPALRGTAGLRVQRRRIDGQVLLVDDVLTTGASIATATAFLRCSGITGVHGAVVAIVNH